MHATHANLSQIFALYRDPDGTLDAALAEVMETEPDVVASAPDGTREMWVVTDPEAIAIAQKVLGASSLTIADGHHRYETALTFREESRTKGEPPGAESLMVYLSNMDDPDLTILPYHRYAKFSEAFDYDGFRQHLTDAFEIEPVGLQDPIPLLRELTGRGTGEPYKFGFYTRQWGWELATLRSYDDVAGYISEGHGDAWRHLDVAVLHDVLLGELARRATDGGEPLDKVYYTAEPRRAASAVRTGEADIFCMVRATEPQQIVDVVRAGDTMPQKSTYFYPKLLTGLVMRDLESAAGA